MLINHRPQLLDEVHKRFFEAYDTRPPDNPRRKQPLTSNRPYDVTVRAWFLRLLSPETDGLELNVENYPTTTFRSTGWRSYSLLWCHSSGYSTRNNRILAISTYVWCEVPYRPHPRNYPCCNSQSEPFCQPTP